MQSKKSVKVKKSILKRFLDGHVYELLVLLDIAEQCVEGGVTFSVRVGHHTLQIVFLKAIKKTLEK